MEAILEFLESVFESPGSDATEQNSIWDFRTARFDNATTLVLMKLKEVIGKRYWAPGSDRKSAIVVNTIDGESIISMFESMMMPHVAKNMAVFSNLDDAIRWIEAASAENK